MPDLLLEIGTEELPAGFLEPATSFLRTALPEALAGLRLSHGDVYADATPRRLVVTCRGIAARQEDREEEVTGPRADVAWDKDGKLTKAALGFLQGRGLDEAAAYRKETKKGEVIAAVVKEKGLPASEVLAPALEALIPRIPFKKRMRFSDDKASFGRPPRWLLCLLDGAPLRIAFAGLTSGTTTRGHRFHTDAPVEVRSIADYQKALTAGRVLLATDERRRVILEKARALAAEAGGRLVEDEGLLHEVANLVEHPWPLLGKFDPGFLSIPREILLSEMRDHQKYFAVEDTAGRLLPAFVVVAGSEPLVPADVAAGHARVLRSRFEDGAFYYREDTKKALVDLAARLGSVMFQRDLGSLADKTTRIRRLTAYLAEQALASPAEKEAALRAAELSKADLVSGVVGEFPALQGTMGRYYALASGEPEAVAVAIEEHYAPRTAHDALPSSMAGSLVAAADRLDTLAGILGVGKAPSGSADPFGLRRAAIALVNIALVRGWRFSLKGMALFAADGVADRLKQKTTDELARDILELVGARLKGVLSERAERDGLGPSGDVVDAAIEAGFEDLADVDARARALARMRAKDPAAFLSLAATFKRVGNILQKARADGVLEGAGTLDEKRLEAPAEKDLLAAIERARSTFEERATTGSYDDALETLASLKPAVDKFFDDVMVMVDDSALRAARLALLARLEGMLVRLAAFTRIQVEG